MLTLQAFHLGDPFLYGPTLLVLLKDGWRAFEKFGLLTDQHLQGELKLPTEFGGTMRSIH